MTNEQLVSKVWNYAHVLCDQGISYGDYVEQIARLLFLKMDAKREDLPARIRASRAAQPQNTRRPSE
jgi:hypothetical protein